jgi:hypothetical protein
MAISIVKYAMCVRDRKGSIGIENCICWDWSCMIEARPHPRNQLFFALSLADDMSGPGSRRQSAPA